jgi:hypothetical protein
MRIVRWWLEKREESPVGLDQAMHVQLELTRWKLETFEVSIIVYSGVSKSFRCLDFRSVELPAIPLRNSRVAENPCSQSGPIQIVTSLGGPKQYRTTTSCISPRGSAIVNIRRRRRYRMVFPLCLFTIRYWEHFVCVQLS